MGDDIEGGGQGNTVNSSTAEKTVFNPERTMGKYNIDPSKEAARQQQLERWQAERDKKAIEGAREKLPKGPSIDPEPTQIGFNFDVPKSTPAPAEKKSHGFLGRLLGRNR